jgi:hypothetical protein
MTERLLHLLQVRANHRGQVVARSAWLEEALACSFQELEAALDALAADGSVEIISPLPWLIAKVRKDGPAVAPPVESWSGSPEKPRDSRASGYSYSKLSSNRLDESYRQPGNATLLREILDTLGETDPTTFEGAIKNFAPEVIRKALDRVRRTRSLRKNRTALFRYLLTKLA